MKIVLSTLAGLLLLSSLVSGATLFNESGSGSPDLWIDTRDAHGYAAGFLWVSDNDSPPPASSWYNNTGWNSSNYTITITDFGWNSFSCAASNQYYFIILLRNATNGSVNGLEAECNTAPTTLFARNSTVRIDTGESLSASGQNITMDVFRDDGEYNLYFNGVFVDNFSVVSQDNVSNILLGDDSSNPTYNITYDSILITDYVNRLPNITTSEIETSPYILTNDLQGFCNGTDFEPENITYSWRWYQNSALFSNTTGNVTYDSGTRVNVENISNSSLVIGDQWILSCSVVDALGGQSAFLNSSTALIVSNATLNITIRNEVNEDLLNGTNVFVNLISAASNVTSNTTTGELQISAIIPENYTIRYTAAGWGLRDFAIEIGARTNTNLTLFLLNDSFRGTVIVTVTDTRTNPLSGAIVRLLRYYGSCNCYQTVETAETTTDGRRAMSAQLLDAFYRWIVDFDGATRLMTTEPEALFPQDDGIARKTLVIDIGNDFYTSFTNLDEVASTVTFNNVTETLAYTWNDPSGITIEGCLSARHASGVSWVRTGPNCSSGASGSVLLTLPNTNETRYLWTAFRNTNTDFSPPIDDNGILERVTTFPLGDLGVIFYLGVVIGGAILFSFSALAVTIWTSLILIIGVTLSFAGFAVIPFGWTFASAFVSLMLGVGVFMMRR